MNTKLWQRLFLKACPRCRGDVHVNRDVYGTYRECLQCGHIVDIDGPDDLLTGLFTSTEKEVA